MRKFLIVFFTVLITLSLCCSTVFAYDYYSDGGTELVPFSIHFITVHNNTTNRDVGTQALHRSSQLNGYECSISGLDPDDSYTFNFWINLTSNQVESIPFNFHSSFAVASTTTSLRFESTSTCRYYNKSGQFLSISPSPDPYLTLGTVQYPSCNFDFTLKDIDTSRTSIYYYINLHGCDTINFYFTFFRTQSAYSDPGAEVYSGPSSEDQAILDSEDQAFEEVSSQLQETIAGNQPYLDSFATDIQAVYPVLSFYKQVSYRLFGNETLPSGTTNGFRIVLMTAIFFGSLMAVLGIVNFLSRRRS